MARIRIDTTQRRARLAVRHALAPEHRVAHAADAARAVVALHGTDPASVHLSAAARMHAPDVAAVERALYEERSLVRILGMRRTVFVVPVELRAVVQESSTRDVARRLRRQYTQQLEQARVAADTGAWLRELEESAIAALRIRGEATAVELGGDDARLRTRIRLAEGKSYAADVSVITWVLGLLAADGRIVRARPRGSWISGQFAWAPTDAWLTTPPREWHAPDAQTELVRRWLAAFGPGTAADLRWWTGWNARDVSRALADAGAVEVDLDGATGYVLAGDVDGLAAPEPWAALLPALDPTVMGWQTRDWFLGEHRQMLFDRSGNAGPTVWWDGRVIGGWAQGKGGDIRVRLLEDAGADAGTEVEASVEALRTLVGDVRVTPRFRTPLEKELTT